MIPLVFETVFWLFLGKPKHRHGEPQRKAVFQDLVPSKVGWSNREEAVDRLITLLVMTELQLYNVQGQRLILTQFLLESSGLSSFRNHNPYHDRCADVDTNLGTRSWKYHLRKQLRMRKYLYYVVQLI
jgi:hypothetical protein